MIRNRVAPLCVYNNELPHNEISPLNVTKQDSCVYTSRPIAYDEIVTLVNKICRIAKIYTTSYASLFGHPSKSMWADEVPDAPPLMGDSDDVSHVSRILTMACLMAVVDRLVRIQPKDKVSILAQVLEGLKKKKTKNKNSIQ